MEEKEPFRAWYVIHTYSGYENKVKANLESTIKNGGMEDQIFDVVVPMMDEVDDKEGQSKVTKRKVFPGYVLIDMIVNNKSWYVVRNTTGVTGFVGSEKEPIPLTEEEVKKILGMMSDGKPTPKLDVAVGDVVRINSGTFENFNGTVTDIDVEKGRLKVVTEMFGGSETLVELDFNQVDKNFV